MAPQVFSFPSDAKKAEELYGLAPGELEKLHVASTGAKATAYCPYSKFRVGAALLSRAGGITTGANVENASYPITTCAERVAFGRAITDGVRGFKAIAVATDISPPASPCGMCRQCIREFCNVQIPIIMFDKDDKFMMMRLEELLPNSFGPESLGIQTEL